MCQQVRKEAGALAITQEQFDELVARLEVSAARNPRLYSLKLGAFASLGYFYVFTVLVVLLAIVGVMAASLKFGGGMFLLVKNLAVPLLILMGIVLRSMWVKIDAPQGLALSRKAHPNLFATLDELREETGAPKVHAVLLVPDLNAAVVQVPRLGMFGWPKNHLLLGLPLLQLLSAEEFRAVLAHEFGHLSGAHGRFGAWIYRVRASWARLAETLQMEQHWGRFMFVPFFSWYAPQFAAYSFVKARQQEYEADQLAANTVGRQHIANALVRLALKDRDLNENYWSSQVRAANDVPEPNSSPYRGLLKDGHRRFLPAAPEQLRQALLRKTSTADTHPCLRDRIEALGAEASLADTLAESAASVLLGEALGPLVDRFDEDWRKDVAEWWQQRHEYVAEARQQLAELDRQPMDEISDDDLYTRAALTEDIRNVDEAFPLYSDLAARSPDHQAALFAIGRIELQRDNEEGLARLEAVMKAEPGAVVPGCEVIMDYLQRHGREDELAAYRERHWKAQEKAFHAMAQRQQLLPDDRLVPHDLPAETLEAMRKALDENGWVKLALLARKEVDDDGPPMYVLGFVPDYVPRDDIPNTARDIAEALQVIPENIFVIPLDAENKRYRNMLSKVENAEFYSAADWPQ